MLFQEQLIFKQRYLENSDCGSCRQFIRRRNVNNKRKTARARGVPENQLPTVNEPTVGPNLNCEMCIQRKAYKANKKRQYASEMRKKINS